MIFNPRRACARVSSVCVCLLSHISPLERLFVLKSLPRTQRATEVDKIVGFSSYTLRSRATAFRAFYGYLEVGHFLSGNTRVSLPSYERYQRLQRLKRANICSVFTKTTAFQLHGRKTATANPGCRAQPRIINFFELAHNA